MTDYILNVLFHGITRGVALIKILEDSVRRIVLCRIHHAVPHVHLASQKYKSRLFISVHLDLPTDGESCFVPPHLRTRPSHAHHPEGRLRGVRTPTRLADAALHAAVGVALLAQQRATRSPVEEATSARQALSRRAHSWKWQHLAHVHLATAVDATRPRPRRPANGDRRAPTADPPTPYTAVAMSGAVPPSTACARLYPAPTIV